MNGSFYLNKTVWCKLGPSKIHGVGVFAIRDIPKGQKLTDFSLTDSIMEKKNNAIEMSIEEFKEKVHPEIQNLVLDRLFISEGVDPFIFQSPNRDCIIQSFMNHSDEANSDGEFALRDIKAGEEVTENFKTAPYAPLGELSKNHYSFLN